MDSMMDIGSGIRMGMKSGRKKARDKPALD